MPDLDLEYCERRIRDEESLAGRALRPEQREQHLQTAMLYRAQAAIIARRAIAARAA